MDWLLPIEHVALLFFYALFYVRHWELSKRIRDDFVRFFLFSLIVLLSTNKQKNQNALEYNTIFIKAILMRLIYMHFKWFSELKSPREDHFNAIYGFCGLHLFVWWFFSALDVIHIAVCALTTFFWIICVILNFAMPLSIAPTLLRTIDFQAKY